MNTAYAFMGIGISILIYLFHALFTYQITPQNDPASVKAVGLTGVAFVFIGGVIYSLC